MEILGRDSRNQVFNAASGLALRRHDQPAVLHVQFNASAFRHLGICGQRLGNSQSQAISPFFDSRSMIEPPYIQRVYILHGTGASGNRRLGIQAGEEVLLASVRNSTRLPALGTRHPRSYTNGNGFASCMKGENMRFVLSWLLDQRSTVCRDYRMHSAGNHRSSPVRFRSVVAFWHRHGRGLRCCGYRRCRP